MPRFFYGRTLNTPFDHASGVTQGGERSTQKKTKGGLTRSHRGAEKIEVIARSIEPSESDVAISGNNGFCKSGKS